MTPYYEQDGIRIFHGDCRDVLPGLEPVSAVVTDPPYGLGFMGKGWDKGVPGVEFWQAVARVALPGAHLLAFGGTRTVHRLVCAIEDAGFEIRDMIAWVYGSGFPKSLDVSKAIDKEAGAEREVMGKNPNPAGTAGRHTMNHGNVSTSSFQAAPDITAPATDAARQWDGWGTALKPAMEPICVARKPFKGTVAGNVLEHGTGALNVDGCRVGGAVGERLDGGYVSSRADGWDRPWKHDDQAIKAAKGRGAASAAKAESLGRWPANLIHDGSDEATAGFPETASVRLESHHTDQGKINNVYGDYEGRKIRPEGFGGDSGSAARFFYCAKANDRDTGNDHPTVKPTALMRYLCLLITPPGGVVLDPFMGSGTTVYAAKNLGHRAIGVEIEERYCEIAAKRLSQQVLDFGAVAG